MARTTFTWMWAVMTFIPVLAMSQTSELYLADEALPVVYVVQNGAIVREFPRASASDGPGLVVRDSVRCIGQEGGAVGHEYSLDGVPLSGEYPNPGYEDLMDGATDGVSTWSIAHNDFNVSFAAVRGDADWGGLAVSFHPTRRSSGITYDANTRTLWITNTEGSITHVQQYDLAGVLLWEFPVSGPGGGYGIAWDPADDTLWIPGSWGTNDLFQYSKDGTLLHIVDVPGLPFQLLGAEFQSPVLFADGFESGSSGRWSTTFP